jgi:hypothetical protein
MVLMTRIGSDAAFLTEVVPAVVVFGLGLAGIVAPVTTTALGAVPDERAGAASGVNNAVARTGGLLAVAAIPGLVGLTGDALGDPVLLEPGFDRAMVVSAVIVAAAGVSAFFLLPSGATLGADEPGDEGVEVGPPEPCHLNPCPVDGSLSSVGAPREG